MEETIYLVYIFSIQTLGGGGRGGNMTNFSLIHLIRAKADPMPDWKIARFATSGRACMVNHCPQMMKWRPPLMGSLDPSLHHQLFGQSHYASLLSSLGSFIYLPKHQSMLELQYSMKLTKKEIRGRMFQKLKYTVLFIKVE